MTIIYEIGLYIFYILVLISSIFNKKAKLWIEGRKKILKKIKTDFSENNKPVAWFHCASLGEFEQGRPVIEDFKNKYPNYKILLTFFSPSGYEIRKNYTGADYIYYLPLDSKINARKFIKITKPKIAFFIKYEFWHNYINQLSNNNIPIFLISGIFRKNQVFFKWYGNWYRKILKKFTHLFLQDNNSIDLIKSIGIITAIKSGDTRFDRVIMTSEKKIDIKEIETFKQDKQVFISGSTWPVDDELLIQFINKENKDIKYIIAPHEISNSQISNIQQKLNCKSVKFSNSNNISLQEAKVLIIDSIGMLSALYSYGDLAYIGGGFGKGIHNTLEAAAFGLPIIFGPKYKKFQEAVALINKGAAFAINNYNDYKTVLLNLLEDTKNLKKTGEICKDFVTSNKGVTSGILNIVTKNLKP